MKKIIFLFITILLFSCRAPRDYRTQTKNFIGYGTYQPPNKKGLDK